MSGSHSFIWCIVGFFWVFFDYITLDLSLHVFFFFFLLVAELDSNYTVVQKSSGNHVNKESFLHGLYSRDFSRPITED